MDDVVQSNIDIVNSLNDIGMHTYRDGKLLATIGGFNVFGEKLTIDYIEASWDGEPTSFDLPYHFVGYVHDGDPLSYFYKIFKNAMSLGKE